MSKADVKLFYTMWMDISSYAGPDERLNDNNVRRTAPDGVEQLRTKQQNTAPHSTVSYEMHYKVLSPADGIEIVAREAHNKNNELLGIHLTFLQGDSDALAKMAARVKEFEHKTRMARKAARLKANPSPK